MKKTIYSGAALAALVMAGPAFAQVQTWNGTALSVDDIPVSIDVVVQEWADLQISPFTAAQDATITNINSVVDGFTQMLLRTNTTIGGVSISFDTTPEDAVGSLPVANKYYGRA